MKEKKVRGEETEGQKGDGMDEEAELKMEGGKDGRIEGWKGGRMEGWKDGRMKGWKGGRM